MTAVDDAYLATLTCFTSSAAATLGLAGAIFAAPSEPLSGPFQIEGYDVLCGGRRAMAARMADQPVSLAIRTSTFTPVCSRVRAICRL